MKKLAINEEFVIEKTKFVFTLNESGKMVLKNLGPTTARGSKEFTPPTREEVIEFFTEKGYTEKSANTFYDYYEAGDWKDKKGAQVKMWKQKAISVWLRDENKAPEKGTVSVAPDGQFRF